jgi:hypothetical protein
LWDHCSWRFVTANERGSELGFISTIQIQNWSCHSGNHHNCHVQMNLKGPAFNVTHFESRITHLLYTARNTTEHG